MSGKEEVIGLAIIGCGTVAVCAVALAIIPFVLATGLWFLLPLFGVALGFWKCFGISVGLTLTLSALRALL